MAARPSLVAGRYFGLGFRRNKDTPTLPHKYPRPFDDVRIDLQNALFANANLATSRTPCSVLLPRALCDGASASFLRRYPNRLPGPPDNLTFT